jgi:hypothetical protein
MDVATALLLALAIVGLVLPEGEAEPVAPRVGMPLPPAGGAPRTPAESIRAQAAALGEVVTVEDLARGVLALEQGALPGVAPLDDAERSEVARLLGEANARREELLAIEGRLAGEESRLAAAARAMAETLTPEQRAWLLAERDRASVGAVERVYWDAVLEALDAPRAP